MSLTTTATSAQNGTTGTSSGTTGDSTGTAATTTTATSTTGAGGVVGSTTEEASTSSTTSALSPSPLGDNCQQLRLPANRDTVIWGMSPDDNYDFRGLGEDVLEVWQYGSSSKRVLLRFEIYLNTPASWTIAAAHLELQALLVDSYGGRLDLHRVQKDWEERVVNWNISTTNQPWSLPGGDFDSEPFSGLDFTPAMQDTIAVWDVTTEVQRIHAGGENYGWMLKEAGEPEQGNLLKYAFPGRDTENAEQATPTLAVHFCE
ncbi:MAG TPA: DNRLRE domain-containing protein [Polyangiaceae bacterium]|nr:DNRLRE domain-containing protein [Polyangiaceae bacterium]